MPDWPAMMELEMALAYTRLGEDSFRSLLSRHGVRAVDLGNSLVRWRKADIDAMIDRLPLRQPRLGRDSPASSAGADAPIQDPAAAALDRARKRTRR
jgi:hypothetical protein